MNYLKRVSIYSLILLIAYLSLFVSLIITDYKSEEKSPSPVGVDFAVYYTAGQMVINGQSNNLYDLDAHHIKLEKVLNRQIPFVLGWFYPPSFLLLLVPLAFLPFQAALVLWIIVTLLGVIYAAYLLVPKNKYMPLFVCGFPGVLMNLRWGQNGFLNTALIGFGLYFMERRPMLSGLMFGFLTYKPQMAFFPLLLLLITKKWRVLFWSILFSLITALCSGIIFGFHTWNNFLDSFFNSSSLLLTSAWETMTAIQPTLYSALRLFGVEGQILLILLGIIAIAVTIASLWVWRNTDRLSLRGSVLVLGILLTMPYYVQYDLMILSIPVVLLSYDFFEHGYRLYELALLVGLWFMPLINWPLVFFTRVQICPFVLIVIFIMIMIRTNHQCLRTMILDNGESA